MRPREYFQGKEIQNLTLTFAGGKLTAMTGSGPGFGPMKGLYDAAGEGEDLFAVIDLGINPNIKLPAASTAGTIMVGIGSNVWAGGSNKTPYGYFVSLPGNDGHAGRQSDHRERSAENLSSRLRERMKVAAVSLLHVNRNGAASRASRVTDSKLCLSSVVERED